MTLGKQKEKAWQTFLTVFVMALACLLPFMIIDKGYFLFYGDFNTQQIPFYMHAHEAIRSGNMGWDWYTDLGSNFIGSYSFYLLGSPFFWLTVPLPAWLVPYTLGPLLALKMGVAALTAYVYLRYFVKNPLVAQIGGILYAFSGFSVYNIFFNHFHEPMAFFPLLLIGLEELMRNNRKGIFALAVFFNCTVNYFFFFGQVVFLVIYFAARVSLGDWELTVGKILSAALESAVGVMMSGALLLPSILAVSQNPRTGQFLSGWNAILYGWRERYPAIIQAFFFPPDIPSRPVFFPEMGANWSSLAGWLPMFSMSFVIAYLQSRRRTFIKRILYISLVMAFIPGLNSLFYMLNDSYYARWFYMPILIMVLATCLTIEDEKVNVLRGFKWNFVVTAAIMVVIGLIPVYEDGVFKGLGVYNKEYGSRFWLSVAVAFGAVLLFAEIIKYIRSDEKMFLSYARFGVIAVSIVYTMVFLISGKTHSYSSDFLINTAIRGGEAVEEMLPDVKSVRVDSQNIMENTTMYWGVSNIQAFQSVVPGSIMEFYPYIGVTRDVNSYPSAFLQSLRTFLSVKYRFVQPGSDVLANMAGFQKIGQIYGFDVYENQWYIPIGFTYDEYLTREDADKLSNTTRSDVMLRAIILDTQDAEEYGSQMTQLKPENVAAFYTSEIEAYSAQRRAEASYEFTRDNNGFTSKIKVKKNNLVFFSVPYESGWSATVNGQPARIVKANVGFMAVECPAGDNEIRFTYHTPGLAAGAAASGGGMLILAVYLLAAGLYARRHKTRSYASPAAEQALPDRSGEESEVILPDAETKTFPSASDSQGPPVPPEKGE